MSGAEMKSEAQTRKGGCTAKLQTPFFSPPFSFLIHSIPFTPAFIRKHGARTESPS
jgi:hypothetical protein